MTTRWIDSPIGGLLLSSAAGLVTAIGFDARAEDAADGSPGTDEVLDAAEAQLAEYFAGERREFDLPLANDGLEFHQKVWRELRTIPYGQTRSYGDIARQLGYDSVVSRAVGAACGANPLPIVVPCHRVVAADGGLTGYAGGIERKRFLLDLERPGLF